MPIGLAATRIPQLLRPIPSIMALRRPAIGAPASSLARDFVFPGPVGGTMPKLLYGTAWKEERTADLVYLAIKTGFRAIDTAAQPRHYREDLVGEGIRRAVADGLVSRRELYIQTKFTPIHGQDANRLPYNATDPIAKQVASSVASSLRNLAVTPPSANTASATTTATDLANAGADAEQPYLDALLLHAPYPDDADTLAAWRALAAFVPQRVRRLGISNAPPATVQALLLAGPVPPVLVQNRFFEIGRFAALRRPAVAGPGGDGSSGGVLFQSFHTLAIRQLTHHPMVTALARAAGVEPVAALYGLVLGLGGTTVLDGTASEAHMRADLVGVERLGQWVVSGAEEAEMWRTALDEFRGLVRDG